MNYIFSNSKRASSISLWSKKCLETWNINILKLALWVMYSICFCMLITYFIMFYRNFEKEQLNNLEMIQKWINAWNLNIFKLALQVMFSIRFGTVIRYFSWFYRNLEKEELNNLAMIKNLKYQYTLTCIVGNVFDSLLHAYNVFHYALS